MSNFEPFLSVKEQAVALELANITHRAATATLPMLIDPKLELGPPEIIEFESLEDFSARGISRPSVLAVLRLMDGFQIPFGFIVDVPSAHRLSKVMMGSSPGESADQITDMELSAVGEAISQMMGMTTNALSQFLAHPVEMTTPEVDIFTPDKLLEMMPETIGNPLVMVKFPLLGSPVLAECELMQITPLVFLRQLIDVVLETVQGHADRQQEAAPVRQSERMMDDTGIEHVSLGDPVPREPYKPEMEQELVGVSQSTQATYATATETAGASQSGYQSSNPADPVTVQPVEFPSFDSHLSASGGINKNLELVMDVCLNLTVELGRTELSIKEVLELTRGSVIELNRVAGESVDLFANGKMIAKGEVVVIEDNFGLRITSIVSPADRLRGL